MSPDVVTVEHLREAHAWVSLLAGAILGLGGVIFAQGRRIDSGCPSCAHCAAIRAEAEAKAQAERERLFGREVTPTPYEDEVASDEESSGDEDGGDRD